MKSCCCSKQNISNEMGITMVIHVNSDRRTGEQSQRGQKYIYLGGATDVDATQSM